MRYEKRAALFSAMLTLGAALLWLTWLPLARSTLTLTVRSGNAYHDYILIGLVGLQAD